jgi:hypothetical protein
MKNLNQLKSEALHLPHGSDQQIESFNLLMDYFHSEMTDYQLGQFEQWCLKATTEEIIAEAEEMTGALPNWDILAEHLTEDGASKHPAWEMFERYDRARPKSPGY